MNEIKAGTQIIPWDFLANVGGITAEIKQAKQHQQVHLFS